MSRKDFSGEEFETRFTRTRKAISQAGLDWMVLFHTGSIHWLTGSDIKSYQAFQCLLVAGDAERSIMIMRGSDRYEFEGEAFADELVTYGGGEPQDPIDVFAETVKRLGLPGKRVGIEVPAYYLHPHHYLRVKDVLGDALVSEPTHLVQDLKMVKSAAELQNVRKAAGIADAVSGRFAAALQEGQSENALAAVIYAGLFEAGSGLPASPVNLAAGERSVYTHGAPSARRLKHGDFGGMEFGATYHRYTAIIGRQFSMGEPSQRKHDIYQVMVEAADACMSKIKAGVPATVPHEAAAAIIDKAGLGAYRIHTTGNGLGTGFSPTWAESVSLFGGNKYTLKAGMVLSIEPGVHIGPEQFGTYVIDTILVTETGCELLTRYPRDLIVV